jgi:hypothetical protein
MAENGATSQEEHPPMASTRSVFAYPDVGSKTPTFRRRRRRGESSDASGFVGGERKTFETIFRETPLFLAPTEYSTTAPLKNAAGRHLFRAATMPGFSGKMIPALRVDYGEVGRRVALIKERLDRAEEAEIEFVKDGGEPHRMIFDLVRTAHGSRFPKSTAGNLPSGEAYIVPYEGEQSPASRTRGELPVEFSGEVLVFAVEANKALAVRPAATLGPAWKDEAEHLRREPAYGKWPSSASASWEASASRRWARSFSTRSSASTWPSAGAKPRKE